MGVLKRSFAVFAVMLILACMPASVDPAGGGLQIPAGPGATGPFLANAKGAILMSWLEPVPHTARMALRFSRFASGKWSPARTIADRSDFVVNFADVPSIAEDTNGVLFAHWMQKSGSDVFAYDVRVSISKDAGKSWGAPILLNRDGKKVSHGFVSLAALPRGGVGAAWVDGRNMTEGKEEGNMTVRYATIDARGTVASDEQLDDRTCECCTTGLAVSGGQPVVVYRDRSLDEVRDISVVRKDSAGWSKPHPVHGDGWKIAGCPVNGPQIASWGKRAAVAWFTGANGTNHVYAAFTDDAGKTFSAPVAMDGGRPLGRVDVIMPDAEHAVVIWSEQTALGAEIRARRLSSGLKADSPVRVAETSASRTAGFPRAASIGQDILVAWTDPDRSVNRIQVARVRF